MPNQFENLATNDAAGNFDIKVTEADGAETFLTPDQRWRLLLLALYNTRLKRKFGSGSPEGIVSADLGWLYSDIIAGSLYLKTGVDGTAVGWVLIGGGGMAPGQQIFANNGDPNGVVTAGPLPSICLDTSDGSIWWKTDGINSNTGWT
jgi:hypothetical protein